MTNPGTSGLTAWWSMDELDDTSARVDKTGFSGNLSVQGDPTPADLAKYGVSTNLVSTHGDYLTGGTGGNFAMGNFHMTCGTWFRPHSISGSQRIMGKWTSTGKEWLLWYDSGSKNIYFGIFDGTSNRLVGCTAGGQLAANNWYFCVGYHDSVNNLVGVGVNDNWNTASAGTAGINTGTTTFTVGCDPDGSTDQMNGIVDEMFIYRQRLLTSAERTWLYNDGFGKSYYDVSAKQPPSITIDQPGTHDPVYVHILDSDLDYGGVIDNYYSLVWTERFNEAGDFEMELPFSYADNEFLTFGNYIYLPTSDRLMMIQKITPTHSEEKDTVVIEGESVEAILKSRRTEKVFTSLTDDNDLGQVEITAYDLIWKNVTHPTKNNDGDTGKRLSIISQDYPEILKHAIWTEQLEIGTNVYDAIVNMCKNSVYRDYDVTYIWLGFKGLGFHLIPDLTNKEFFFYIYSGTDRASEIFFSRDWHNVKSSSIYENVVDNVTLVNVITNDTTYPSVLVWEDGSSEGPTGNEPTGVNRIEKTIEINIDRTEVTPNLTNAEVLNMIINAGQAEINSGYNAVYEGEFDLNLGGWTYGEDFFLGDIVRCDLAGKAADARVIEVVRSYGVDGRTAYLTMDFDLYQLGQ